MNKLWLMVPLVVFGFYSCGEKQTDFNTIEGSWRCQEYNPLSGQRVYLVDIERSNKDTTQYLISNFYNVDFNEFVFAYRKDLKLTIPQQAIVSVIVKSGTGTISEDLLEIDFDYIVLDGASEIKVHAIYTRP
jgi:hypothetical protein